MEKLYDDRDWMYEEYVVKDRQMKDIAEQFGFKSITPIKTRLRKFGLNKSDKPTDRGTHVTISCSECLTEFTRTLREIKRSERRGTDNGFCSRECYYSYTQGRENPNKARKREDNGLWKGGVTTVNENLRESLSEWKRKHLASQNYTCFVTRERGGDLEVHHVNPFHKIRDEVLEEFAVSGSSLISEIPSEVLPKIKRKIARLHEEEPGYVLKASVHREFHRKYGFNTNLEDLLEFKENYREE